MTATAAFFDELGRQGHEPFLEAATGTVRFDRVDRDVTEHWLIAVDKGDIVVRGRTRRPTASSAPTGSCSTSSSTVR
jgi:hypothetical protein